MPLLGSAALAMWWDMSAETRADFEDWHAHEHFVERMAIPGFRRGTRWRRAGGGEGVFVLYELEAYETLSSPQYLARLNAPTPWSTRLMPHHRNMVRSQNMVLESRGGVVASHALTVRLSPVAAETVGELRRRLGSLVEALAIRPGLVGAHLLQHRTPAIATTTEQRIRGDSDLVADWILVACGYDSAPLEALAGHELSAQGLEALGAAPDPVAALFTLAYSATPGDVA